MSNFKPQEPSQSGWKLYVADVYEVCGYGNDVRIVQVCICRQAKTKCFSIVML